MGVLLGVCGVLALSPALSQRERGVKG